MKKKEYINKFKFTDYRDFNSYLGRGKQYSYIMNLKNTNPKIYDLVELGWAIVCLKKMDIVLQEEYKNELFQLPNDFLNDGEDFKLSVYNMSSFIDKPTSYYESKSEKNPIMVELMKLGWLFKCLEKNLEIDVRNRYKAYLD